MVMTDGNDQTLGGEEPVLSAELTPYRSLGFKGFKVFFLIAGLLSLIHAVVFMVIGAWPIVFFFGLDFALLFGAFWLNYRSARSREEVSVSRTDVSVRKFTPSGRMIEHRFNPFWARFNIARHQEDRHRLDEHQRWRPPNRCRLLPQPRRPRNLRHRVFRGACHRAPPLTPDQSSFGWHRHWRHDYLCHDRR